MGVEHPCAIHCQHSIAMHPPIMCFCCPSHPPKTPLLQYPELPEPVMDKLLTMDANELEMILQYPQATQQTVSTHCYSMGTCMMVSVRGILFVSGYAAYVSMDGVAWKGQLQGYFACHYVKAGLPCMCCCHGCRWSTSWACWTAAVLRD